MNRASMRLKFKGHTSGLGDDLTDAEIDEYLDLAYLDIIPADVGGELTEIVWVPDATGINGTYSVAIPDRIVSIPTGVVYIHGTVASPLVDADRPMAFFDDFGQFVQRYPDHRNSANTGKPDAVALHDDSFGNKYLIFNKWFDDAYYVNVIARGAPAAMPDPLGNLHAMATITAASWIYLLEKEDTEGASREGGQYEVYKSLLNTGSHSNYTRRRPMRSFK